MGHAVLITLRAVSLPEGDDRDIGHFNILRYKTRVDATQSFEIFGSSFIFAIAASSPFCLYKNYKQEGLVCEMRINYPAHLLKKCSKR